MSTVTSETAQTQFLLGSFGRSLRARNLSPRTVDTYTESVRQFAEFLERQGMPIQIVSITREHVESFIEELLGKWKPATANNRYRGLQTYFGWLVEEGEMISPLITLPLISPNSGLAADDSINRIQEPIGKARNKDGQANQMTLSNNSSIEDWSCSTPPLSNSMPCDERNSFDLPQVNQPGRQYTLGLSMVTSHTRNLYYPRTCYIDPNLGCPSMSQRAACLLIGIHYGWPAIAIC